MKTTFVSVIIEGMEWNDGNWTAKGRIQFHETGAEIEWQAKKVTTIVVTFDETYPESVITQLRGHVRNALGRINLPFSHQYKIKVK